MRTIPLTVKQANEFILKHHRHHKETRGHRFSLGLVINGELCGVICVGRPVARGCDPFKIAEVTRLCTDGSKNACSFLYAKAARICKEMGFEKIQTYILEDELGTSLEASGWSFQYNTRGGQWNHTKGKPRRTDQPIVPKKLYMKELNNGA